MMTNDHDDMGIWRATLYGSDDHTGLDHDDMGIWRATLYGSELGVYVSSKPNGITMINVANSSMTGESSVC